METQPRGMFTALMYATIKTFKGEPMYRCTRCMFPLVASTRVCPNCLGRIKWKK
ncbi:MAG TPA: hypothetical protein VJJ82_04690 [Candidatus Nanoarchaeia archaeon]|nr:hypothetical protein [Candidatus Nanoarchaeia archaeon]